MKERRRHKRLVIQSGDLPAKTVFSAEVDILDISQSGISVRSTKGFHTGAHCTIKFKAKGKPLSVKAVVMWVKLVENWKNEKNEVVPVYVSGMEFRNVTTDQTALIADFIEERRQGKVLGIKA